MTTHVTPEQSAVPVKFPKPIFGTDITEYPADYLAVKNSTKEEFLTLKDGRSLCYIKICNPDEESTNLPVICLHGGTESKWVWLQKTPLPGITLIAIDRMGYGKSDFKTPYKTYTWDDVIDDISQLATHINDNDSTKPFALCGFSVGTSWSLQCAASGKLKDRLKAILLFATMGDPGHGKFGGKPLMKQMGTPPGCVNPAGGCCGCLVRSALGGMIKDVRKYKMKMCFEPEYNHKIAQATFRNEFAKDPFWVCTKIDSFRGFHDVTAIIADFHKSLINPWKYDCCDIEKQVQDSSIKVFIFQGKGDDAIGARPCSAEFVKKCVPSAELEWIEGTGHNLSIGPHDRWRNQVINAVATLK